MIKTINTGVAELVLVKSDPSKKSFKSRKFFVENQNGYSLLIEKKIDCKVVVCRLEGSYELLGIAHGLSEEVWKTIVDVNAGLGKYKDYVSDFNIGFDTATESGLSLLRANEIFDVNPYEDQQFVMAFSNNHENRYDKAQQNTGKWVFLKKTNV